MIQQDETTLEIEQDQDEQEQEYFLPKAPGGTKNGNGETPPRENSTASDREGAVEEQTNSGGSGQKESITTKSAKDREKGKSKSSSKETSGETSPPKPSHFSGWVNRSASCCVESATPATSTISGGSGLTSGDGPYFNSGIGSFLPISSPCQFAMPFS